MKVAIVTVPYITTDSHYYLAKNSYESMPSDVYKIAIVNNQRHDMDSRLIDENNDHIETNDFNCLSRGWNKGIQIAYNKGYTHVLIPNLDVKFRKNAYINLLEFIKDYKDVGLWSMSAFNDQVEYDIYEDPVYEKESYVEVVNDDQSFSTFMIDIELYKKIGEFDEQFKPAYFEDCDYLYRCNLAGVEPLKCLTAQFWHFVQGAIKNSTMDDKMAYNEYFERSKELYIKKWGGEPSQEIFKTPYNL